ncbi:hypothetical protein L4C34_00385 [Vibrio profundum]|uniref:hypothetical protein n=1 Tax=Vibrio profundum TaxID=2910247 RepID=UPI003D13F533
MLTQDVTQELHTVLSALEQQGKEPTVALVKARMTTSVPMPALIATIKKWKSNRQVPKVEVASAVQDSGKIEQLEKQVASLSQRVEQLEKQLQLDKQTQQLTSEQ